MNTEYDEVESGKTESVSKASGLKLKGTHFGIKVVFPDDHTDKALLKLFTDLPDEAYALPLGRGIVLDFQARPCSERFITRVLRGVIWPKKLNVLAWLTTDEDSSKRLNEAGFCVTEPQECFASAKLNEPRCRILHHSLRSGQHEEYSGDVILAGHLNEGAEIFASGSVYVLGRLKGLVHAGCNGIDGVCVVTASFEARQLRIGDSLCDQLSMKWWKKPVIITLEEDGLLFREWTSQ